MSTHVHTHAQDAQVTPHPYHTLYIQCTYKCNVKTLTISRTTVMSQTFRGSYSIAVLSSSLVMHKTKPASIVCKDKGLERMLHGKSKAYASVKIEPGTLPHYLKR